MKPCFTLALLFAPLSASAHDWEVEGHVVTLEGSNMPQFVPFSIDVAAGNCPAGTFLQWNIKGTDIASRIANAQYVASILLTAKTTQKPVRIFGNNSGCTVDYIWAE